MYPAPRACWFIAALVAAAAVALGALGCGGAAARGTPWHDLADRLDHADAVAEGPEFPAARVAAIEAAQALLTLGVGEASHQATSIYYCRGLTARGDEPPRRCQYIVADDTIHTAEVVGVRPIAAPPAAPVRLRGWPAVRRPGVASGPAVLALEYGETGRMHASGYRHMSPVRMMSEGALVLPDRRALSAKPGVLTVAVRLPERPGRRGWVVKWVWLLDLGR